MIAGGQLAVLPDSMGEGNLPPRSARSPGAFRTRIAGIRGRVTDTVAVEAGIDGASHVTELCCGKSAENYRAPEKE